jgi:hypothetical protein
MSLNELTPKNPDLHADELSMYVTFPALGRPVIRSVERVSLFPHEETSGNKTMITLRIT